MILSMLYSNSDPVLGKIRETHMIRRRLCRPYLLNQMPRLLFISLSTFLRHLFESGDYFFQLMS